MRDFCIPASQAFGTGQHATTAGCLAMLSAMKARGVTARNVADIGTGTGRMIARCLHRTGRLREALAVYLGLLAGEQGGIFLVPQSAVIQSEQGNLVMTADAENKVAPRPVQTGEWFGKDWIVLDGLKAGDKVIVDNLMKLKPGAPVDPHPPAPPAGAPAPEAAKPAQK